MPICEVLTGNLGHDIADAGIQHRGEQSRTLHHPAERTTNPSHRTFRAGLAAAMLVDINTSRRIIGVPTLVAADHERIVATVGPAIQTVLAPSGPTA